MKIMFCAALILLTLSRTANAADSNRRYLDFLSDAYGCGEIIAIEDAEKAARDRNPGIAPDAFATAPANNLVNYIGGFLSGLNAVSNVYNVYKPGLISAYYSIGKFCRDNPSSHTTDAIFKIISEPNVAEKNSPLK
ncbi:hypothetical protein CBA19CS22_39555 [Caballeronia novacaledonica]|uniref:Uncharacterized protein n=1 Tax=Caballeronia novacaledonica TaxID=1544861 RepID=A0ACB5R607_9BURK|nr:hypothetical protein CBA19CS22_39555 [Caballeronia novacaledonica]